MVDVIENATPRKKAALEVHGIAAEDMKLHQNVSKSMAEYLRSVKNSRKKDDLSRKHLLIQKMPNWKKKQVAAQGLQAFQLDIIGYQESNDHSEGSAQASNLQQSQTRCDKVL